MSGSHTPKGVVGSYELDSTGDVQSGYLLELERTLDPGGGAPTLKIRAKLAGGTELEADLGPGTQREGWRHIVLTYFGGIPSSAKLYVNADGGSPAAEKDDAVFAPPQTPQVLRLGAGQTGPNVVGHYFEGWLDEVAYYSGPLSNKDVQTHYLKSY